MRRNHSDSGGDHRQQEEILRAVKSFNLCLIGVPEGEDVEDGGKSISENTMDENFLKLLEDINPQA